jgi:hypothetical protein
MQGTAPRFLVDGMLGRLAKWLRLLGYDAEFDRLSDDRQLARRARAEGRVLLTCDRELAGRRGLGAVLVAGQELGAQMSELQAALQLPSEACWPARRLPRCCTCNGRLHAQTPSNVVDRVPPYVQRTQQVFFRCLRCGRIYWDATHAAAIREQLARTA